MIVLYMALTETDGGVGQPDGPITMTSPSQWLEVMRVPFPFCYKNPDGTDSVKADGNWPIRVGLSSFSPEVRLRYQKTFEKWKELAELMSFNAEHMEAIFGDVMDPVKSLQITPDIIKDVYSENRTAFIHVRGVTSTLLKRTIFPRLHVNGFQMHLASGFKQGSTCANAVFSKPISIDPLANTSTGYFRIEPDHVAEARRPK